MTGVENSVVIKQQLNETLKIELVGGEEEVRVLIQTQNIEKQ
jgi:hypothetical protein